MLRLRYMARASKQMGHTRLYAEYLGRQAAMFQIIRWQLPCPEIVGTRPTMTVGLGAVWALRSDAAFTRWRQLMQSELYRLGLPPTAPPQQTSLF